MPIDPKRLKALADTMSPLTEVARYQKDIIYGDPGVGKTVEAAKVADAISKKWLFLEADPAGWDSLFNHRDEIDISKITRMEYDGVSQLELLAEALEEGSDLVSKFDTLLIDTASHISDLSLDTVLAATQDKRKKDPKKGEFDFETDMWGVYRQNTQIIKSAFLKIYKAPINVISTAHVKEREIKKLGIVRTGPSFTPEILSSIMTHVSLMVYMTASDSGGVDSDGTVEYVRKMQFHPTRTIMAKTRIGGLPSVIENPDLRQIILDWRAKGSELLTNEEAEQWVAEELSVDEPLQVTEENDDFEKSLGL